MFANGRRKIKCQGGVPIGTRSLAEWCGLLMCVCEWMDLVGCGDGEGWAREGALQHEDVEVFFCFFLVC